VTWALARRDTDPRTPEHADRPVADAARPPRKQGTKRSMEFRLACCITSEFSRPASVAGAGRLQCEVEAHEPRHNATQDSTAKDRLPEKLM
jgi:hypothetical protein